MNTTSTANMKTAHHSQPLCHHIPKTISFLYSDHEHVKKNTAERIMKIHFRNVRFKVNIKSIGPKKVPEFSDTGSNLYRLYHTAGMKSLEKGHLFPELTLAHVFIFCGRDLIQVHPEDVQNILIVQGSPVIPARNFFWI